MKVNEDPKKYSKDISLSRRHFCLCGIGAAGFAATAGWLTPRQAFAEARGIVSLIKDSAAKATITTHKLRGSNAKAQMHPGKRFSGTRLDFTHLPTRLGQFSTKSGFHNYLRGRACKTICSSGGRMAKSKRVEFKTTDGITLRGDFS